MKAAQAVSLLDDGFDSLAVGFGYQVFQRDRRPRVPACSCKQACVAARKGYNGHSLAPVDPRPDGCCPYCGYQTVLILPGKGLKRQKVGHEL